MTVRLAMIGVISLSLGTGLAGCATVDLQTMAGAPSGAAAEAAPETNVVQRAAASLRDVFTSRGFGERSSQRKVQAAANLLLNGLSARTASDDTQSYAKPIPLILEDVTVARTHVEQTTQAAEVYIALAQSDRDLAEELDSLQSALLASERAARLFETALNGEEDEALAAYRVSIDGLRTVTDEFGARVRLQNSGKLAVAAAS